MCIARRPIVFLGCVAISSSVIGGIGLWAQQSGDSPELDSPQTPSLLARSAQAAYESTVSAFNVGGADVEDVYRWSRRCVEAEESPSIESHLTRMEELHQKVAALNQAGAAGGEAVYFHATAYYVAEARQMMTEFNQNNSRN